MDFRDRSIGREMVNMAAGYEIEPKAAQNGSLNAEFAEKLRNRPTNSDYSAMYGQILQSDCDQFAIHCINTKEEEKT